MFGVFTGSGEWIFESDAENAKFPEDNFCTDIENCSVMCEGFLLNSSGDTAQTAADCFMHDRKRLYNLYKGSFVIAAADRASHRYIVVNDLLSKKPVYFYKTDGMFCFSTSFWKLYDYLAEKGEKLTLNEAAVRCMLRHGYMLEDMTCVQEIKFLMPFQLIDNGEIVDLPMPEYDREISSDEAVKRIDSLFLEGCRLQLEKNEKAGYNQVCSLSGGMDSRAVLLCMKRLGYKPDLCFTYAESGSDDERISKQIAGDFGCEHVFFPMDGGGFLSDRSPILANEGFICYSGTTGLTETVRRMDCGRIGIAGTGIGGGEIFGDANFVVDKAGSDSYIKRVVQLLGMNDKAASNALADSIKKRYADCNVFCNLREMRICVNFSRTAQPYFEACSPFLYEDFFCFLLTLPPEMRTNRKLYLQWYDTCLKNDYEIMFRSKKGADERLTIWKRAVRKFRFTVRALRAKINKAAGKTAEKTAGQMNPHEYWWATNPELRDSIDAMFRSDMDGLKYADAWLLTAINEAYAGNLTQKLFALTLTWTLNRMKMYN